MSAGSPLPCNFYGTIYGACNVRYCHPPMAQSPQIVSGTTFSLSIKQPFLALFIRLSREVKSFVDCVNEDRGQVIFMHNWHSSACTEWGRVKRAENG